MHDDKADVCIVSVNEFFPLSSLQRRTSVCVEPVCRRNKEFHIIWWSSYIVMAAIIGSGVVTLSVVLNKTLVILAH